MGDIIILDIEGAIKSSSPINFSYPFSSAPIIIDIDKDNDLEILSGMVNSLSIIDIKENGTSDSYWNMYRGNNSRSGTTYINGGCTDPGACNYDIDAFSNDSGCIYSRLNEDCSGNCLAGFDLDECGVCGGPGIPEGACDCTIRIL